MFKKLIEILLIVPVLFGFWYCTEKLTDNKLENQPPETNLFIYPDDVISQQPSRIELHWQGDDPDGLVVGYYYSWNGSDWEFTGLNSMEFALRIGANDTDYVFYIMAVDNNSNGIYDSNIDRNGIDLGPEPFNDVNNNATYDDGEEFIDIGDIDPSPASQQFPIKNSKPEIEWNELTVLPDTSFPIMTFRWNASDIDGDESISKINIAVNDTSSFVSIDGTIRLVTLRTDQFDTENPQMEILLNGNENFIADSKLNGLKFDSDNRFFVQAEDISGARTNFISLPDTSGHWYVKKPRGKILIIDNYVINDNSKSFYKEKFDSLNNYSMYDKYDVWDLIGNPVPFRNITFSETIKLYDGIFWYTDNSPDLDLASTSIQNYLNSGGKIAFSLLMPRSIDLDLLQGFLPIDSIETKFITSVITGADIVPDNNYNLYPALKTNEPVYIVRTFVPSQTSASALYHLISPQVSDNDIIGLKNNDDNLVFIGMPLHKCDGIKGGVLKLLDKIFIDEFGLGL
ncbi:MAG: hypothetical protein JW995_14195 [Melioribacteraceae bacterium]|nr:hypothetical protein [Melioribacteraceae bacterium]